MNYTTPTDQPILDTLSDIEAFEQTPLSSQFPASSSYELIQQSAERFGEDTALEFLLTGRRDEPTQSISFRTLASNTTRTANLLFSLGIQEQDAVSILLPILLQSHQIILGAQAAGIANPINPMLEANHIAEIINAAEAKIVVCLAPSEHSDLWQKLQQILPLTPGITTVIAVHCQGITSPAPESLTVASNRIITVIDYDQVIKNQAADALNHGRALKAEGLAAYFHTGGTTGKPKLAQLTHGNMAFLGQLMQVFTAHMQRQTVICGLPLFHIYGVIIQGVASFSVGYRIILLTPSGFRSAEAMKNFWHHVDRFKVKSFSAVPTVLTLLSQLPVGDADISSLETINSGAAPLSPSFETSFEKKFKLAVSNGYGMTETTSLISRAPEFQPPGSVGMRLPYSSIRIAELDGIRVRRDCSLGESGVVLVKGPQVFKGYKSAEDNALAWVEDGWFNTGDLGYMDADGFLYLSGRAKDLIIRSGHNIDPELIEEPLNAHPAVAAVTAIGFPDPYAGELPMAYVVLKPGVQCTSTELMHYCETHISERAAIPKRIEIIDAMPLTAVGKIFRPSLRQRITKQVIAELLDKAGLSAQVNAEIDKQKDMQVSVAVKPENMKKAAELLEAFPLTINILPD
ncbi:MAG: acyl-CoA synthetase [Pseudomonadales bacterium]|nr:acyl-CoA synthetase [Pseudomonadales bacterium]